jgi:uncharacterized repeat protein (TIGR01451 family)
MGGSVSSRTYGTSGANGANGIPGTGGTGGTGGLAEGGAAYGAGGSPLFLNDTVSSNRAGNGGGLFIAPGTTFVLENSIVSGNTAATGTDVSGTPTTSDHNLIGGAPLLAPLRSYGGPTETMPLLPGSPGIDAGDDAARPPTNSLPGLLDWYKAEGNTLDSAGGHNGTATAGVSYVTGAVGEAFSFNGQGSYLDLGTGPDVVGTVPFSVAAWIKTTSDGVIIQQRDASNFNGEYQLAVSGGKVYWWTFGNGQYGFNFTSNRSVNDGNWHFVVATRLVDGNGQIYIDGALDSHQAAALVPIGSNVHVYVGEDVRNAHFPGYPPLNFVGQIDEVQIYSHALVSSEVQGLLEGSAITSAAESSLVLPGLTHRYSGEGNANDSFGSSNGTPQGNVSYAPGKVGQAFRFNGSSSVSVPSDSSLGFTSAVTLDAWVNPATLNFPSGYGAVVAKSDSTGRNYGLFVTSGGAVHLSYIAGTGNNINVTSPAGLVKAGAWTNVAGVIDTTDGVLQIYVNGDLVASQATGGPMLTDTAPLTTGSSDSGRNFFNGLIDEVQIYNRALTPADLGVLISGSPVGPRTDQRGYARTVGTHVDIGATEYQYDLALSGSAPAFVPTNDLVTCTLTVTNNGPDTVAGALLSDVLPATEAFQSLTAPAGWAFHTPAVGQSGTVTAADTANPAPGASATFTLVLKTTTTTPGTVIKDTVTVGPITHDRNTGNNSVTLSTTLPTGVDIHGQPSSTVVGRPISPAVTVSVVDAHGKTIPGSTQLVTLAIASGPAGAVLGGTTTVAAVDGVATFRDLTLNVPGTYTLTATGGRLTPDFSNSFTVAPADPTPPVDPAPSLSIPSLLGFFNAFLKGIETLNADGSATVTDSLFGLPVLVSTYDASGHLVRVTFLGMNVTGMFGK